MRPIPKKMLIHNGIIAGVTSEDRWGNETIAPPMDLEFIRIEPTKAIVRDKQNNEVQLSTILFYDCKNSLPKGATFAENTVITINSKEYTIKTVEALYDGSRLHHYELGLI